MVSFYLSKWILFPSIFSIFGLQWASIFCSSVFCLQRQKQCRTSGLDTAPVDLSALDKVPAYRLKHELDKCVWKVVCHSYDLIRIGRSPISTCRADHPCTTCVFPQTCLVLCDLLHYSTIPSSQSDACFQDCTREMLQAYWWLRVTKLH